MFLTSKGSSLCTLFDTLREPLKKISLLGLKCQSREQREWHGGRATKGVQGSGKYFYEALVTGKLLYITIRL